MRFFVKVLIGMAVYGIFILLLNALGYQERYSHGFIAGSIAVALYRATDLFFGDNR